MKKGDVEVDGVDEWEPIRLQQIREGGEGDFSPYTSHLIGGGIGREQFRLVEIVSGGQ